MHIIKSVYLKKLLVLSGKSFPSRKTIEEYMNGDKKAQENTVRALASFLGVKNWRDLVESPRFNMNIKHHQK